MDKQKQIEEMADTLCESKSHNCNGEDCKCIKQATDLYNEGYRKIDEGSTIISKKKLLEIANDYTEMAKFHTEKHKEIDQARKQAIKDFIQAIKKDVNITYYDDEVTTFAYVDIDDIYYIAIDKFGVEI